MTEGNNKPICQSFSTYKGMMRGPMKDAPNYIARSAGPKTESQMNLNIKFEIEMLEKLLILTEFHEIEPQASQIGEIIKIYEKLNVHTNKTIPSYTTLDISAQFKEFFNVQKDNK